MVLGDACIWRVFRFFLHFFIQSYKLFFKNFFFHLYASVLLLHGYGAKIVVPTHHRYASSPPWAVIVSLGEEWGMRRRLDFPRTWSSQDITWSVFNTIITKVRIWNTLQFQCSISSLLFNIKRDQVHKICCYLRT